MRRRPLVLAYHGVGTTTDDLDPYRLVLDPALLEEQIALLIKRRYRFVTAEELLHRWPDRRPPVGTAVLTFDDGWLDATTTVVPMLRRLGVRATFYVCPGWLGGHHPLVRGQAGELLDTHHLVELSNGGMEVASHSMLHRDLRLLGDDELADDLVTSKAQIEDVVGRPCRTFAYPYGLFDDRVIDATGEAGYDLAFAWQPGRWRPLAAPRLPAPPRHGARRLGVKMLGLRKPDRLAATGP